MCEGVWGCVGVMCVRYVCVCVCVCTCACGFISIKLNFPLLQKQAVNRSILLYASCRKQNSETHSET